MSDQNASTGRKNGLVIKDWPYRVICTRTGRDITHEDRIDLTKQTGFEMCLDALRRGWSQ